MGRLEGQPGLAARAAAVREGRRRQRRAVRQRDPDGRRRGRAVRGAGREASGAISVERSRSGCRRLGARRSMRRPSSPAARFDRRLDVRWRRTSYSDITAAAHEPLVGSEPERPILSDEPGADAGRGRRTSPDPSSTCLAARHDAGRARVRHVRPHRARGDRLRRAATSRPSSPSASRPSSHGERSTSATPTGRRSGLPAAIETPFGESSADPAARCRAAPTGSTSSSSSCRSRAATRPTGRLTLQAIAGVLREHLPAGDPDGRHMRRGSRTRRCARDVRGFLTGSIDL